MNGQTQQIRLRHLFVSMQPPDERRSEIEPRVRNWQIAETGKGGKLTQQENGVAKLLIANFRIGRKTEETRLRQRAKQGNNGTPAEDRSNTGGLGSLVSIARALRTSSESAALSDIPRASAYRVANW